MRDIKRKVAKTVVNILAVIGREVVEDTLTVYGVAPNAKDFLEEVSEELGRVSNGTAELYRVTGVKEYGTVTMVMDASVFKTYATIMDDEYE